MIRTLVISALLALVAFPALSQSALQLSHIERNVPPSEFFETLLRRDLLGYFNASGGAMATKVEFKLLRDTPTQSGVAYPKYYLWVKVFAGPVLQREGAVRVAAIDRKRFEVTDFMAKAQIQSAASEIGSVFPAALVQSIIALAAAK
jgi:hypothetical protein